MAAGDAIRKYVSGAGWQTVAPDNGGNGGSLPDWWTIDSTPGSESVEFAGEVHIRSDGDLFDAMNVAEDWGLIVGGDGRTLVFSDPSVNGRTFDITGGPNGSASFRFLLTDSGLMEDLLQVIDDDNNQVAKIGSTGTFTISPGASETLKVDEDEIGFFGAATIPRPEIPASPNAQDIADVLVALGLCTQAA